MRHWVWVGLGFGGLACGGAAPTPAAPRPSPTPAAEHASPPRSAPSNLVEARQLAERANRLMATQRYQDAADTASRAFALLAPGNLEDDRVLFQLEMIRAEAFRNQKDLPHALPVFEAALAVAWRHEGVLRAQLVEATLRHSETLSALHREADSIASLERALQVVRVDANAADRILAALIVAHHSAGSPTRAKELLSRYVTTARRLDPQTQVVSDIDALAVFDPPKLPPAVSKPNARVVAAPAAETLGSSSASFAPDEPLTESKAVHTGDVSNAAVVVAEMRAGFRTCYQRALAEDAATQGTVRLMIRIGADGHVTDVRGASLGLQTTVVDCLLRRATESVFNPPEGGSAQIAVPVTFVKQ